MPPRTQLPQSIYARDMCSPGIRSLVSFGPKQRSIGEPAKTLEISNFRNTVGSLKRLLGRTISDPEIADVESKFTHVKLVDANGTVGAQVCMLSSFHSSFLSSPSPYSAQDAHISSQ